MILHISHRNRFVRFLPTVAGSSTCSTSLSVPCCNTAASLHITSWEVSWFEILSVSIVGVEMPGVKTPGVILPGLKVPGVIITLVDALGEKFPLNVIDEFSSLL